MPLKHALREFGRQYALGATALDASGNESPSSEIQVTTTAAPVVVVPPTSGGGGGSVSIYLLLLLGAVFAIRSGQSLCKCHRDDGLSTSVLPTSI